MLLSAAGSTAGSPTLCGTGSLGQGSTLTPWSGRVFILPLMPAQAPWISWPLSLPPVSLPLSMRLGGPAEEAEASV